MAVQVERRTIEYIPDSERDAADSRPTRGAVADSEPLLPVASATAGADDEP